MGEGHIKPHDYVGRATDWHTTLRAVAVKYRCTVALRLNQFRKNRKTDSQMVILKPYILTGAFAERAVFAIRVVVKHVQRPPQPPPATPTRDSVLVYLDSRICAHKLWSVH